MSVVCSPARESLRGLSNEPLAAFASGGPAPAYNRVERHRPAGIGSRDES